MKGCEEKDEAMESDIDIDEKTDGYMGQGPAPVEQEEAVEPEETDSPEGESEASEKESPHSKS